MRSSIILVLLISLLTNSLAAKKNDILITIGDQKISKAEFEHIYKKNNQVLVNESDKKTPKEYARMYIDFKLKVIEAIASGMDTTGSFREELEGYRNQLAAPYLTDMQYDRELVEELYERMKLELNASHILFRLPPEATAKQEEFVLEKANRVRQEIRNGLEFNEAALKYSEDPSVKTNNGNLGYFSAFQMVAPFENAAFKTEVGQISEPVRTKFGYHLIRVHDIRENRGEIKVAHIMKMFPRHGTIDKIELKAEIDSIYQKLIRGVPFEELVERHSDDKRSVANKGELPWFSSGGMIPELAEPAFKLKNDGDISTPVETPFGFHIIRRIDHKPVPSFEEIRPEIETRLKKDPERSLSTTKVFVEKLKEAYGYQEEEENVNQLASLSNFDSNDNNLKLFTFADKKFFLNDFKSYLIANNKKSNFDEYFKDWCIHEIIEYENAILEEKYPEFKYLMQEYHDGILFFNIMEEMVWKKASEDSVGLQKFYESNRKKHKWGERFSGLIIKCETTEVRNLAEQYFSEGIPCEEVQEIINTDKELIKIERGAWEPGTNPIVDYYVWNKKLDSTFDPELTFVRGKIIKPQPKSLDEGKGLFISEYQDHLEKKWVKSLRRKYKIKTNRRLLKKIAHV